MGNDIGEDHRINTGVLHVELWEELYLRCRKYGLQMFCELEVFGDNLDSEDFTRPLRGQVARE